MLTFFSLYMHTLPLNGYAPHGPASTLPAYYGASEIYTVGSKALDPRMAAEGHFDKTVLGLRVRASYSSHAAILGWIARGTKIKIGQKHGAWGRIESFVLGAVQSYQEVSAVPAAAATGWVFLGQLDRDVQPSAVDSIYILPKPHKIAAGEIVAHIGEYQRFTEARAHHTLPPMQGERPLLHIEVFTGEDIHAFITRSRARAQQLDPRSRNLLLISKGAKLVQPSLPDASIPHGTTIKDAPDSPDSGPWRKVVVLNANGQSVSNQALWVARSEPNGSDVRPAWSQFPLRVQAAAGAAAAWVRVVNTASAQHCVEAEGKTWYAVSTADEENAQVNGWVCDHGHPLVELKSPWDWPGFDIVKLDTTVSDMFQRALFLADSGTPDEVARFEDSFNSARSDEAIRKLEDAIDSQEQRDGKITARELRTALRKPWLADRIDHLIVAYESEWGGEMSKWNALDPHMHAGLPVWQSEKSRIETLRYWSSISGVTGWPSSANVYHIHPIGLVGNFLGPGACACGCCLNNKIQVVRWNGHYGPCHGGTMTLATAPAFQTMLSSGELTASERRIIAAMAPNEGKLDSVQAYDDQVVTAGAMQKTMRATDGGGELPRQIADFRAMNESAYQELFARCGWTVQGTGDNARLSFSHPEITGGQATTGHALSVIIRQGCDEHTNHQYLPNPAIAALAHAVSDLRYQKLQIKDFVDRLRKYLAAKPTHYDYTISQYFQGDVGRATVLDHSVNRPAYVADDLKRSLDRLFAAYPNTPRNPDDWGAARPQLERALADDYGTTRRMSSTNGVSVAPARYHQLRAALQ